MKKHLIAAAVAAAVAVPAMAQNVSLSGRIDTSVGSLKKNDGTSTTEMNSSRLTTNQIVISGSEDLGGGLRANFRILTGFNSDSNTAVQGAVGSTAASTTGFDFGGRGMQVGLSGGFGSLDLGRSTGTHANASVVTGGLLGNLSPVNLAGASLSARPNNSITYSTPTFQGFRAQVIHGLGSETDPRISEQTEFSFYYSAGAFSASLGVGDHKEVSGTAGNKARETSAVATYTISGVTIRALYLDLDYKLTASDALDSKGWGLGVSMPLSGAVTGVLEYTDIDTKADPVTDRTRISAGAIYGLSKRTNVYAVYAKDNEKRATLKDGSILSIGIRHGF